MLYLWVREFSSGDRTYVNIKIGTKVITKWQQAVECNLQDIMFPIK